LVIGGYGVFGGRLVRILADEEGLTLLVAGLAVPALPTSRAAEDAAISVFITCLAHRKRIL